MTKPLRDHVDEAAGLVAHLEARHAEAVAKQGRLAAEVRKIAFAAFGQNNEAARTKVDALNKERAELEQHVDSLAAAIVEAERRLTSARQQADWSAEHAKAAKVLVHLAKFREQGAELDRLLAEFAAGYLAFEATQREMSALGAGSPRLEQLRVLGRLVIVAALQGLPLTGLGEHLSPAQRRTFAQLIESGWAQSFERWARERGAPADKECAA